MAAGLIVLHGIEAAAASNAQRRHLDRTDRADVDVVFQAAAQGGDQSGMDLMLYLAVKRV